MRKTKDQQVGMADSIVGDLVVILSLGVKAWCVDQPDAVPVIDGGFFGGNASTRPDVAAVRKRRNDGGFPGAVLADESYCEKPALVEFA